MLGGFIRPRHIANFLKHQPGDNIGDRWRAWLRSQGAKGFNTHDLEIQWLRSQGYTGTFADMFYAKFGDRDGAREYFNSGGFFTDFDKTTFLSETMTDNKLRNLTLYGSSTQAGTPTPDAPVPIESTTGDVTVQSVAGLGNLFDKTKNIVTGAFLGFDNVITNQSSEFYQNEYIRVKPSTTYTFSSANVTALRVHEYSLSKVYIKRTATGTESTLTVTTSATTELIKLSGSTSAIDDLQFELGSVRTTYKAFVGSTQTLPLGTTQLRSLPNGVSDRIYKSGSTWKLEQNVGSQTITGGATGAVAMTNGTQFIITVTPLASLGDDSIIQAVSDRFIGIKRADRETVANSIYSFPGQDTLRINTTIASDTTTLNDWLATNQPVIQYILATPITTTITDPALITALENIRTYLGITNITAGTPISGQYPRP